MITKSISYLLVGALLTFSACSGSGEDEVISSGLVNNPASAQNVSNQEASPVMVFESTTADFGEIVQGETVTKKFKFTNEGDMDLIISAARGTCGCTVPKWPKKPFKKGESGEIEVVFNSNDKEGKQIKKVYITANTVPTTNEIVIKGFVVAPK